LKSVVENEQYQDYVVEPDQSRAAVSEVHC
jgi:hypothetical protein